MTTVFRNAGDFPLNAQPQGTVPDVSGALMDWLQPMVFTPVTKVSENYQAVETGTPFNFQGVWQPFKPKDLLMRPEGQRDWDWFWCHSLIALPLNVDDVIIYRGEQFRVLAVNNCSLYGFFEYQLCEDWRVTVPDAE
jgi:hypothetical protein